MGLRRRRLGHGAVDPTGRVSIPASTFVIRFPDGDYEYDLTRRERPAVGDTLRRKGSLWSVTRVTDGDVLTVHVDPAEVRASGEGDEAALPASP